MKVSRPSLIVSDVMSVHPAAKLTVRAAHPAKAIENSFNFLRWLDLSFYQLVLQTPANLSDG